MKCALVTIHDHNYKEMSDLTWHKNRKLYAQRRNYGTYVKTDDFGDTNIGFWKIKFLLEVMDQQNYEFFHFSGTDTMLTNFTVPMTEFLYDGYSVTISTDFNGIQADSFCVRNDKNGIAWLEMIMNKYDTYVRHPFYEQGVMMDFFDKDPWRNIVKVVPQRFLNSYHYPLYNPHKGAKNNNDAMGFNGQWQKGDWLLHCPDQKMHIRMPLFNQTLPLVIE